MRLASLCVLFIFLSSLALAQSEKLPDILKPDASSEAEAQRIGADVFKLVPRGMFQDPPDPTYSYKDEDNPIGIRSGGSSYSFSTGLHSYNKIPQIQLDKGNLYGAFGGYDLGFLVDLGSRDLQGIETSPEAKFFVSYKPPMYEKDLRQEQNDVRMGRVEELELNLRWSVPAKTGDTYLLRAVSWNQADIAVAFRILKIEDDGSATIVWKPLAKFPKPFYLFMTDEELQQKIGEVISEEKLTGIEFTVKDNWVYWMYLKGSNVNLNTLYGALNKHGIRYRGQTMQAR